MCLLLLDLLRLTKRARVLWFRFLVCDPAGVQLLDLQQLQTRTHRIVTDVEQFAYPSSVYLLTPLIPWVCPLSFV
jgi:hypothetical protein